MPAKIIKKGSDFNQIQDIIDSNDEIEFESNGFFDIGENTIWVKGPKKIRGNGAVIHGNAYRLMADFMPKASDGNLNDFLLDLEKRNDSVGCGIFSTVGPGRVEISNFTFDHQINKPGQPVKDPNMPYSLGWHTSATVAHFVDNQVESSLRVRDCIFKTSATAAVDVWSINDVGTDPKTHDIIVRNCTLIPMPVPGEPADVKLALENGAGSYCGVVLGGLHIFHPELARPVNMSGSRFEVRDCDFDPQKYPAIACFNYVSDSETEFRICNNRIGCNSPKGEATALGILLGLKETGTYPKGTVLVMDNEINIETYFRWAGSDISAGISIPTKFAPPFYLASSWGGAKEPPRLETVISGNKIHLRYDSSPHIAATKLGVKPNWCVAGIFYEDKGGASGPANATAIINNNIVSSDGPAPPFWGICLSGTCHDVVVKDNDLSDLTASHAQIYVDETAYDCVVNENVLGEVKPLPKLPQMATFTPSPEAVVLCKGDSNWLLANDFSNCKNVPGWKPNAGPGFVELGSSSKNNVFVYAGNLPKWQILDKGTNNHIYAI